MRVLEFGVLANLAISVSGFSVGRTNQARGESASSTVPPSSSPTSDAWKTLECSAVQGDAKAQWEAAGANAAWNTTMSSWMQNRKGGLSQFVSSFLHGPQYMRCSDIATENRCSQPVECKDATIPAGALILNGFAGIHQLHASVFQAIGNVQADVSNDVGSFTSTFAPQPPKETGVTLKNIFDSMALVISLGSAAVFNIAMKQVENVVAKAMVADALAASMGAVGAFYKTNMRGAIEGLQVQNTIDSYLGETMNAWKGIESDYLDDLFSDKNTDTNTLYNMINNGAMGEIMNTLDLNDTSNDVKKILYGQMIPYAWSVSQDNVHPFIWRTEEPCDGTTTTVPESTYDLIGLRSLPPKVNACFDGKLHYLLNAHPTEHGQHLVTELPGGDHLTMDGSRWGGIIIEDIIESSVSGWLQNKGQNGYPGMNTDNIVSTFGKDVPSVRTAGFFQLPVCTDGILTLDTIQKAEAREGNQKYFKDSPYYPCPDPNGYNIKGTNIHVPYHGCIVINESKLCAGPLGGGSYNVRDSNKANSTATIYSKFNGDDKANSKVTPGCKLNAQWPRDWADLDFNDDCLEDRNGYYKLCCDDTTVNQDLVTNPYAI